MGSGCNGRLWEGLGLLGKAWERTREVGGCSGMLEFSLGAHNSGCGGVLQLGSPWFCSSAIANGKDRVVGEVQRQWSEWL